MKAGKIAAVAVLISLGLACGCTKKEIRSSEVIIDNAIESPSLTKEAAVLEETVYQESKEETAETMTEEKKEEVILVENPGFEYYHREGKGAEIWPQRISLQKIEEMPNEIIDIDEWFGENNLSKISNSYQSKEYSWYTEGENHYDQYLLHLTLGEGQNKVILDFSNYRYAEEYIEEDYPYISQRITHAKVKEGILYVATSHNTYAESCPQNAYITAIDLKDYRILWKTQALVCNSYTFEIIGDSLICGYGFTSEKDFLYILDIHTGKVTESLPLASMAEYIIAKEDRLFVRTYNTNYVFRIGQQ